VYSGRFGTSFAPAVGADAGTCGGSWGPPSCCSFGIWGLLVPPGSGIEWLIGYQPWLDQIHRNLELREQTLMREEPPVDLLSTARKEGPESEAKVWLEDGEALDLHDRDLRYADFFASSLWDADLREAELQGANLRWAKLQGASLRNAVVYGTDFWGAELSLTDLRGVCSLPVGWKCPPKSGPPSCESDWSPFSGIEELEAKGKPMTFLCALG